MQAWSLSLPDAPHWEKLFQEASNSATLKGSSEQRPAGAGSSRLTSGMHEAALPSGSEVDDPQSSSALLPWRSSYPAASTADKGSARSTHVEVMHELHDPVGRGSGVASTLYPQHSLTSRTKPLLLQGTSTVHVMIVYPGRDVVPSSRLRFSACCWCRSPHGCPRQPLGRGSADQAFHAWQRRGS